MKIDLSQFRDVFLQESSEHVLAMESGLLSLRSASRDPELMNAIFRSAHSIKGGAGSFGLTNLVKFTHALENLLEKLRSLEIAASEEVIDVLLQSVEVLRNLLYADTDAAMPAGALLLIDQIERFVPETLHAAVQVFEEALSLQRFHINFRPYPEMLASACDPLLVLRNLAAIGVVHECDLDVSRLPPLATLNPALCYLGWKVDLSTEKTEAAIAEVFEFVEHLADISIEKSLELNPAAAPPSKTIPQSTSRASLPAESSSIRVSTEKVDRLIDLVGELVIAHVMTEQMVHSFTPACLPQLRDAVAAMERNTRELHERVMAIRMLPVGSLFHRYTRTVYDIAKSTGKQIALELRGEETEIDKGMLELLADPMIHLIRNAADHGIESPELRAAAGKSSEGRIGLSAFHRSGRIVIEISDDGAGVDPMRVRTKAIERGLISASSQLTDQQIRMLVFEPGFSTRDEVSDLSGRGVGMDVVRRNIQQMNGTVSLTSVLGQGSVITIELPLTLAIMEALLVRVQDRTLVVPLLAVQETISPAYSQITRVAEQGEAIFVRGDSIPLLRLSSFLRLPQRNVVTPERRRKPRPADQRLLVVIVESGGSTMGLVVDELLGQQQVVLKNFEKNLHKIDGLMGATILGDGCVAPIVDVAGLASLNLFSLQAVEA